MQDPNPFPPGTAKTFRRYKANNSPLSKRRTMHLGLLYFRIIPRRRDTSLLTYLLTYLLHGAECFSKS
jgi:hypothetical protein